MLRQLPLKMTTFTCLVIATCFFIAQNTVDAQTTLCANPIIIRELWAKGRKNDAVERCVDIDGRTGTGNVAVRACDGGADQDLILCGDGTIRNQKLNHCMTAKLVEWWSWWTRHYYYNVVSMPCEMSGKGGIPKKQKWKLDKGAKFVDRDGITQVAHQIISEEFGTTWRDDGSVELTKEGSSYKPERLLFYFKERGKEIDHGRLRNKKSGLCLTTKNKDGTGNIFYEKCNDEIRQKWRLMENGDLINQESNQCLEVAGRSGKGNVQIYFCSDAQDGKWKIRKDLCSGDYCTIQNQKAGPTGCLGGEGFDGKGNSVTDACGGTLDTLFKFEHEEWVDPEIKWVQVGCNQNGVVKQTISNTIKFAKTITKEKSISVSGTIVGVGSIGVATGALAMTVSGRWSLAQSWESSRSGSTSTTYACEYYDNKTPFKGGCMWQLHFKMQEVTSGDVLKWSPQIVRCTSADTPPKCPPFMKCGDNACNECIDAEGKPIIG